MRTLIAIALLTLTACELYTDQSPTPGDAADFRDEIRAWECKHLCPEALCEGSTYAECETSCVAWPNTPTPTGGYCPG